MYEIIKNVISAGGFKLADIQHKIKKLYILGDLKEAQMDELLSLASGGVSVDAERPEMLAIIQRVAEDVEALKTRVGKLEGAEDAPAEGYPAWMPWNGVSKDYQPGAIVSHNGVLWESVFTGQNVWEPGTVGTEAMWVKYGD